MEDDIKCILQDKQFHLQIKSEQKEIIQNVLERKDSMAVLSVTHELRKMNRKMIGEVIYIRVSDRAPTTLKSEGEVTSLSGAEKREVRDNREKW
jgi:hypothetical protein